MKNLRKLLPLLLVFACLLSVVPVTAAAEGGESETELGLTMFPGASVRKTEGSSGIRFDAAVNLAAYEALAESGYTVSHGTVILPAEFMADVTVPEGGNLFDAVVASGKQYVDMETTGWYTPAEGDPDFAGVLAGQAVWRASLVNILDHNYTREFAAFAYVKAVKGAETVYYTSAWSAEDHARSIYTVAKSAYTAGDTSDAIQTFLKGVCDFTYNAGTSVAAGGNPLDGQYSVAYSAGKLSITPAAANAVGLKSVIINGNGFSKRSLLDNQIASEEAATSVVSCDAYALLSATKMPSAKASGMLLEQMTSAQPTVLEEDPHHITLRGAGASASFGNSSAKGNYAEVNFSFMMKRPVEITEGARVAYIYQSRSFTSVASTDPYYMTVNTYADGFKFGDDNNNPSDEARYTEFNQLFSYDTWYRIKLGRKFVTDYGKTTLSYGVGTDEPTNTVGSSLNAVWHDNGTIYANFTALRFWIMSGTDTEISLDEVSYSTPSSIISYDCSGGTAVVTAVVNGEPGDPTPDTTRTTAVVKGTVVMSDDAVIHYENNTALCDMTFCLPEATPLSYAVIAFDMRVNSMEATNGQLSRGLSFFACSGAEKSAIMNISVNAGSDPEAHAWSGGNFGEWAKVRMIYVPGATPAENRVVLYVNGTFISEKIPSDYDYTPSEATDFTGFCFRLYQSAIMNLDFRNASIKVYP